MYFIRRIICAAFIFSLQVNSEPLSWTCDNTQYVSLGQGATVSCTFPTDFRGVYWYDSPANSANLIIRRELQENGEYTTSGMGYTNGSYDVFQNGSLMIANVSSAHDRVFLVTLVDSGRISMNIEVNVVTIFPPNPPAVVADGCDWNSSKCVFIVSEMAFHVITCRVYGVYPAVNLTVVAVNSAGISVENTNFSIERRGDFYDVKVEAELNINQNSECSHDIVCLASGPSSALFHSTRTIKFISESCERGIATLTLSLLIVGSVVLLLIVTALLTFLVKYLRTNSQKSSKNSRASNEEGVVEAQELLQKARTSNVEEVSQAQLLPQKTRTSVLRKFADTLLYWPLHKLSNSDIFDPEVIGTFRTVSKEIDENRREENKLITAGSTAGIVGGTIVLTATLLNPIGAAFLVGAGVVVGAAGAGVNIAAAWDKFKKDERQVNRVKVPLETFIQIQRQLAEVTVFLDFAYDAIRSTNVTSCLDANQVQEIERCINDLKRKQNKNKGTLQEELSVIHCGTVALLRYISNAASPKPDMGEWEDKLENARTDLSAMLPQSIKKLVVSDMSKGKMTFLTLIKLLYFPRQGISHGNPTVDVQNPENANLQVELAHGGLLFGRAAVSAANVGEDFVAVGNSVYRIARGVSVAGVLLSSLGIAVDAAFLRNALIDAKEDKKGKTSQALSDVADYMQIMNTILRELTKAH